MITKENLIKQIMNRLQYINISNISMFVGIAK